MNCTEIIVFRFDSTIISHEILGLRNNIQLDISPSTNHNRITCLKNTNYYLFELKIKIKNKFKKKNEK